MPDIDFVIAWVDGADPAHAEARRRFAPQAERAHSAASLETRFLDNGEIYYLIASILEYAPFVRRVHIVTDNQKPAHLDAFAAHGLCSPDFLRIVAHDTIFRDLDAVRPVFSPRPIEATLWRIPDLAEHFVYSNDDMFLNAPLSPDALFRDGRPVLRGRTVRPSADRLKYRLRALLGTVFGYEDRRPKHNLSQEKGAVLAGVHGDYFYASHHPHPLRRSVAEEFYASHPEVLREQLKFRFRNVDQFNAVALSNNLEIANGSAVVEPPVRLSYIRPDKSGSQEPVIRDMRDGVTQYGCVQSLEKFPEATRRKIHETLRTKFARTLPPEVLAAAW